jgi:hypothetical protein
LLACLNWLVRKATRWLTNAAGAVSDGSTS